MSTEKEVPDRLEHDRSGDVWARHADGPKRDPEADKAVRQAIRDEEHGEYDENGDFRSSTWNAT